MWSNSHELVTTKTNPAIRRRWFMGTWTTNENKDWTPSRTPRVVRKFRQRGLVAHPFADREPPAPARDPLAEAVSHGEFRDVAAHGAGRTDPQRHANVA